MDRPILFSAPMVRALLDGAKTQTRRVVKPRKDRDLGCELAQCELAGEANGGEFRNAYCAPGDRLWVREAWRTSPMFNDKPPRDLPDFAPLRYDADDALRGAWAGYGLASHGKYRPPMFMPRWASRITLAITEVRVERLQDISETDAQAEGIAYSERFRGYCIGEAEHFNSHDPRQSYFSLWETINGPGSVEANPWVWVVEFRAASPNTGEAK